MAPTSARTGCAWPVAARPVVSARGARATRTARRACAAAAAIRIAAPGRPTELAIVAGRQARVPPVAGMRDPAQRARILHALANHELQAIELFAWAVLAYPDTPVAFRRGLVAILADEQ